MSALLAVTTAFVLVEATLIPSPSVVLTAPVKSTFLQLKLFSLRNMSQQPQIGELSDDERQHGEIHGCPVPLPLDVSEARVNTVESFRNSAVRFPENKCMGVRAFLENGNRGEYVWTTYRQVNERVTHFAAGIRGLGYKAGDRIAIMARNRPEWMIAALACSCHGIITVPVYDSYGPPDCQYIMEHSESTGIVAAREHLAFIKEVREKYTALRTVVVMDDNPGDKEFVAQVGPSAALYTHTMSQLEADGARSPQPEDHPPRATDWCTFVYTSGTTGSPKVSRSPSLAPALAPALAPPEYPACFGVPPPWLVTLSGAGGVRSWQGAILTHQAVLAGAHGIWGRQSFYPEPDVLISYLPLAHVFQRANEHCLLAGGHAIGYYSGEIPKLVEDIGLLRPTLFPSVPRVLNKIHQALRSGVEKSSPIKRAVFWAAFHMMKRAIMRGEDTCFPADAVLKSIRAKFGGRIRITYCGSAPLSVAVASFLRVAMGCYILEGYGLTETCSAATAMVNDDNLVGTVGQPEPGVELKLVSLPHMGYNVTDSPSRGEIWVRGPCNFSGYYKDPVQTAKVLSPDGWVRTGDVGMWVDDKRLKVIDRIKNVFKLAIGEFCSCDDLERIYQFCPT
ncbi:putative Long chain acyl-CoA synthetase 7; peroxisomal [Paratrimastix pyriformis]|uniref:Long chain acyl-CoA synthetase 7 n=1 Tax=Paratrimastix pyriformis TaxID=342808 RepID=A0ABQ8UPX8_9EUKA|nr:putative Long chain acyl-CoA synthetase 7; peroxisomal [Paratrimastix pyriformis]